MSQTVPGSDAQFANRWTFPETLVMEAPHIQDAATANLCVTKLNELHSKTRRTMEVEVTQDCRALEIFDTVSVTSSEAPGDLGAGCTDKRFVITGIRYGLKISTLTLLEV